MRINNPRLFNGDMLATYSKIEKWLGLTPGDIQNCTTSGSIPSALLAPLPGLKSGINNIYADNILLSSSIDSLTIAEKFAEQQAAINAVKQYNVVSGDGIFVNKTSAPNGDGITVDTFTISGVVKDSAGSSLLKVDSEGFYVDETKLSGRFSLTGDHNNSEYASVYTLTYDGVQIGEQINIPKDQFLQSAAYIPAEEVLRLTFKLNVEGGETNTVDIPVGDLIDEYSEGNGITITDQVDGKNIVSINVAPSGTNDNKFINLTADGLGLSGITTAIDTAVANAPYAQIVNLDGVSATSAEIAQYLTTGAVDITKNILFVDSDGQTALYFAASETAASSIVDISQEFISDDSAVNEANSEKLITVKAVSGYVAGRETAITESYKNADVELSGVLTSYIAEQTAETVSTVNEKAVEMLEVTGNIGYWEYTDAETSTFTSGNAVATVSGRVIAVYDDNDEQVYPTITYDKADSTSTLSIADGIPCATYTIIYAKRIGQPAGLLPPYDAVTETPAEGEDA